MNVKEVLAGLTPENVKDMPSDLATELLRNHTDEIEPKVLFALMGRKLVELGESVESAGRGSVKVQRALPAECNKMFYASQRIDPDAVRTCVMTFNLLTSMIGGYGGGFERPLTENQTNLRGGGLLNTTDKTLTLRAVSAVWTGAPRDLEKVIANATLTVGTWESRQNFGAFALEEYGWAAIDCTVRVGDYVEGNLTVQPTELSAPIECRIVLHGEEKPVAREGWSTMPQRYGQPMPDPGYWHRKY